MSGLRQIASLPMPNLVPAAIGEVGPTFEWADPATLWVEESYQRNLSERSISLIRKIVAGWSWAGIKPPICARDEEGRLVVVDGQHTAIAAASHGSIPSIPIMIVPAGDAKGRAKAFIGHNTDRLALTQMQMFWAAVEAGDEVAVAVAEGCGRAGAKLCKVQPAQGMWKIGETVAVGALSHIAARKGKEGVAHVLRILIDANRGPVRADEIKAVAWLLWDAGTRPSDLDIATIVRSKTPDAWIAMAARMRETEPMVIWKALGTIWRANLRKAGAEFAEPEKPVSAHQVAKAPKPAAAQPLRPKPRGEALLPAGSPTKRAPDKAAASTAAHQLIDAFIAKNGVTKCPPAAVAPTQGVEQRPEDRRAIERHHEERKLASDQKRGRRWGNA